jgi:DNA repair exonuclease SbcCD ATPase subunit
MANKFDIAFVESKNLGLKLFPVTQAVVTFTVTGADDSTTLQEMRDEVSKDFRKYQKQVNEFIKSRIGQIKALSRNKFKPEAPKLVSGGHATIQKFLAEFKKAADSSLEAYKRAQAKKMAKIEEAPSTAGFAISWTIGLAYQAHKLGSAVIEAMTATPVGIIAAVNDCKGALEEIGELFSKLGDQFKTADDAQGRVRSQLASLSKSKSVSESSVKALESAVDLFESKVLGMESKAKAASSKITRLMKSIPKDISPKIQTAAERVLSDNLDGIITLNAAIKKAEASLKNYRAKLGQARQAAKKSSGNSWIDLAGKALDYVKFLDVRSWSGAKDEIMDKHHGDEIDRIVKMLSDTKNLVN